MPSKRLLQGRHRLSGRPAHLRKAAKSCCDNMMTCVAGTSVCAPARRSSARAPGSKLRWFPDTGSTPPAPSSPPARVASVTSMSRLNLSYLPRTRQRHLGLAHAQTLRRLGLSSHCGRWFHGAPSTRRALPAAWPSSGEKPKSAKHVAEDSTIASGLHHASPPPQTQKRRAASSDVFLAFSASSSGRRAAHIPHARTGDVDDPPLAQHSHP